jgi:hypothetical protein
VTADNSFSRDGHFFLPTFSLFDTTLVWKTHPTTGAQFRVCHLMLCAAVTSAASVLELFTRFGNRSSRLSFQPRQSSAHGEIRFRHWHNMLRLHGTLRRCGEMADATDLKSVLAKARYGFESHHRHPPKSDFTRENRSKLSAESIAHGCETKGMKTQSICQVFVK